MGDYVSRKKFYEKRRRIAEVGSLVINVIACLGGIVFRRLRTIRQNESRQRANMETLPSQPRAGRDGRLSMIWYSALQALDK